MWYLILLCLIYVGGDPQVTTETVDSSPVTLPIIVNTGSLESSQTSTHQRIINKLTGLLHGVRSGKVVIISDNTIRIPNLYFDGTAPEAYFILGTGYSITGNGSKVPLYNSPLVPLPKFEGQDVTLVLPNDQNISDFTWLSIWCYKFDVNLGYVYLHEKISPYPPQTFGLKKIVTSGPIVLVNKKTLYIPAIRYDGQHKNVHFWVGNGTKPTSAGTPIPDEKESLGNLHSYQGQNIELQLPDGITTDNIEYFGVWSEDEKLNLGHVNLKGIEDVPEAASVFNSPDENIKLTLRLPKCCPVYSILTSGGCAKRPSIEYNPEFKVYNHNETHFNNASIDSSTIQFIPYIFALECRNGKYALDDLQEEFAILRNGSLLVKGEGLSGILDQRKFCVDNTDEENKMQIFVCVPEHKIQEAMFYAYVTLTLVSTFCFVVTFFIYFFWMNIEDIHRKCFTAYIFAMSVTFLSLTIVQIGSVENSGCEILGFIFQIAMIASFTLLAILCFDIYVIVKYIDENRKKRKRKGWYLAIAIGVPLLSMVISLARNLTPDVPNSFFKPQYQKNACYFEAENQRVLYFYAPIIVSIIVGAVSLGLTKWKIVQYDQYNTNNYFWMEKGKTFKFMFRQCFITLTIMTICWIADIVMNFLDETSGILNAVIIFGSLQGVLIVTVFSMHRYGTSYWERRRNPENLQDTMVPLNRLNQTNGDSGGANI